MFCETSNGYGYTFDVLWSHVENINVGSVGYGIMRRDIILAYLVQADIYMRRGSGDTVVLSWQSSGLNEPQYLSVSISTIDGTFDDLIDSDSSMPSGPEDTPSDHGEGSSV